MSKRSEGLSREALAALESTSAALYASFSLKAHPDEGGLTEEQASLVRGWKRQLAAAGTYQLVRFAHAVTLGSAARDSTGQGPIRW